VTTWLHKQRVNAVLAAVQSRSAETVLDLGCGEGALLTRLAEEPAIRRIVGIDLSSRVLETLRGRLRKMPPDLRRKAERRRGCMTAHDNAQIGFDAAVLVELIEHIDPDRLSAVERTVFRDMRPATVVITTPNRDFNPLLGVPAHRFRHPDHRFEWGREKFQRWAAGVAARNNYSVSCQDVAGAHPAYGGASQMAIFDLHLCKSVDHGTLV
jgi:3' terminal RNA ribose 2'-O-methyltransferase Hen1